ncbi:MAG: hypothetical protein GEU80_04090 [Dehalococcoidia bacterium]|nr:hypothetical protein [Dehalococcoidia bacterium]
MQHHMRWLWRAGVLGAVALATFAIATVAEAHERREVAGHTFVVGFEVEPALESEPNAVSVRITQGEGDATTPVEGLEESLQVEVTHADSGTAATYPLSPAFGDAGHYTADLIPTATGTYSFRFFGSLGGQEIDEVFESGEGTFSDVGSAQVLHFPREVAAVSELQGVVQGAQDAAFDAEDQASSAQTVATAALAVGALGVVVGGVGVAMAARRKS